MEADDIIRHLEARFQLRDALKGKRAIVTSGPTYEAIDPVRFIGNFSSGKQGYAIAEALALAGAETTLVSGPTHETPPSGVILRRVISADDMYAATMDSLPADIVVCAAAVADWKPAAVAKDKIKKNGAAPQITLTENKDILKSVSELAKKRPQLVIGFAAETSNLKDHARKKLKDKNCDWILANDVNPETGTFGGDFNAVHLLRHQGEVSWPKMTKQEVAMKLVEEIAGALKDSR
jgi:phosphopantothenoylcysteine decarboxylase/phosphopantothenate--cysteine ligase